jgi:hypothetical protein
MKKINSVLVSLIVIGLLAGCGGSNKENSKASGVETAIIEKYEHRVSFSYPKGFFTRSEEKDDRIYSDESGSAFIGKDYTVQVYITNHSFSNFEECKATAIKDKSWIADIEGDGIAGFYRRPGATTIMCLFNIVNGYKSVAYVIIMPNAHKKLTYEELNDSNKKVGYVDKCDKIMQTKVIQDLIKSVKAEIIKK